MIFHGPARRPDCCASCRLQGLVADSHLHPHWPWRRNSSPLCFQILRKVKKKNEWLESIKFWDSGIHSEGTWQLSSSSANHRKPKISYRAKKKGWTEVNSKMLLDVWGPLCNVRCAADAFLPPTLSPSSPSCQLFSFPLDQMLSVSEDVYDPESRAIQHWIQQVGYKRPKLTELCRDPAERRKHWQQRSTACASMSSWDA